MCVLLLLLYAVTSELIWLFGIHYYTMEHNYYTQAATSCPRKIAGFVKRRIYTDVTESLEVVFYSRYCYVIALANVNHFGLFYSQRRYNSRMSLCVQALTSYQLTAQFIGGFGGNLTNIGDVLCVKISFENVKSMIIQLLRG